MDPVYVVAWTPWESSVPSISIVEIPFLKVFKNTLKIKAKNVIRNTYTFLRLYWISNPRFRSGGGRRCLELDWPHPIGWEGKYSSMYLLILQDGAQKQERHNDKDVSTNAHLVQMNGERGERKLGLSLPASEARYDLIGSYWQSYQLEMIWNDLLTWTFIYLVEWIFSSWFSPHFCLAFCNDLCRWHGTKNSSVEAEIRPWNLKCCCSNLKQILKIVGIIFTDLIASDLV